MLPDDPKAKQKQRVFEARDQIAALISEVNVQLLLAAGFDVIRRSDFHNFVLAYTREAQRIRDLHAASERDAGRVSARVEVIQGADGRVAVLVTAPACDETHLGSLIAQALEPVMKGIVAARFDPKAVLRPEPILITSKGGDA